MRAIVSHKRGGPDTLSLEEVADPVAGPGQVLVKVAAVGVNFPDSLIIEDRYQARPERPFSPGSELSGTIIAVGEGVTDFSDGDRVMAIRLWGAMAEFAAVDSWRCVRIPDAMPFDEAAALMITFGTSYHSLVDRARLKAGETLLVLGASGGVGLAAVEIGKAIGAHVVACASSQEKVDIALSHGAAKGVVYARELADTPAKKAFSAQLKEACGADGADVIYDPVGGDYSEPALRAIAWQGRYLVIGFPAGIASIPLNLPLLKGCDILGVFWGEALQRDPVRHHAAMGELFDLYTQGSIRPMISAHYALADAPAAIAAIQTRQVTGKIVVNVS